MLVNRSVYLLSSLLQWSQQGCYARPPWRRRTSNASRFRACCTAQGALPVPCSQTPRVRTDARIDMSIVAVLRGCTLPAVGSVCASVRALEAPATLRDTAGSCCELVLFANVCLNKTSRVRPKQSAGVQPRPAPPHHTLALPPPAAATRARETTMARSRAAACRRSGSSPPSRRRLH